MRYNRILAFLIVLLCCLPVTGGVGESAVITLVFPFGARNTAMGEVGTSLADDESALYYNPAGLGIQNSVWNGGSFSGFFEQLLPRFGISDLWHASGSAYYQPSGSTMGGFGTFTNYINMGENEINDQLGRTLKITHSWEIVNAIGWGFNLCEKGDIKNNFGITCKLFESALAPGYGDNGEGTAQSFAFDIGYLYLSKCGLRIGATLMNMGPDVYYVTKSNPDPIPFTANFALGYKQAFIVNGKGRFSIAGEIRLDKELVVNDSDGKPQPFWRAFFTDWTDDSLENTMKEVNIHTGIELGIMNTGFIRYGYLFDRAGKRYEMTYGWGCNLLNHYNFSFSRIFSPEGYMKKIFNDGGATGVRNGQWRVSLSINRLRSWSKDDLKWYIAH